MVIGGGQAGLVMGYYLAKRGLAFVIADANREVGDMWRSRWQSLKLFTAGKYNNLPGMAFPAAPDTYPGKDAVAGFLKSYAERFELPVRLNTTVTHLTRENGRYRAATTTGPIEADQVVVATGPFQVPFTPEIARQLETEILSAWRPRTRGPCIGSWKRGTAAISTRFLPCSTPSARLSSRPRSQSLVPSTVTPS